MGQYTFKVDGKDPLYKKLIKLPTAYYRLKQDNNSYTIDSHIGTVELGNISDIKLQKKGDEIVLCKEGLVLKLQNEEDFVIKEEDIIGKNNILGLINEGEDVSVALKDIQGITSYFGAKLSTYIPGEESKKEPDVFLNYINFDDDNDPALKKIKEKADGLYFTIKDSDTDCSRTVYISDKDGNLLPVYNDYLYEYKPSVAELETMDSLTKANDNAKQEFTLQKGKELSEDIYEANIFLNDKLVATLPNIGYYMLNDQLVMRNHVTKEEMVIPGDFHYLKVVRCNNNDDYKLTFCNFLGNEFFEYKRYDPQYSNVLDEYKFISLNCAKKEYYPHLNKLFSYQPSFFITRGDVEPDSPNHYSANVFEVASSGKGRKMATLIDEFSYFNKAGEFKHRDYHKEMEYRVYDNPQIDQEYKVTGVNSEFFLIEDKGLTLHTIPELF